MNAFILIFIFLAVLMLAAIIISICDRDDRVAAICGIIVLVTAIGFSSWAIIATTMPNEVQETELLPIENKIIDGKTIQISYYTKDNEILMFNLTKKYGFHLDKDKYLVKKEIMKRGPYAGLYFFTIQDKFTIIEKDK